MDYLGDDGNPNVNTRGLIVNDVSYLEQQFACQSLSLIPKIMHKYMVEPLPRWCQLTALFDVSQVNFVAYEHTDAVSAVWPFSEPPWFVIL
jgi:hypothetical protein